MPSSGHPLVELCKIVQNYSISESKKFRDEKNIHGNQFAITDQALRPIVVHCANGIDRTGVFTALYICMQRLYEENRVDVFSVVKQLRTERRGIITTPELYQFTYRCVVDYLESVEEFIYGNVESDCITARADSVYSAPLTVFFYIDPTMHPIVYAYYNQYFCIVHAN